MNSAGRIKGPHPSQCLTTCTEVSSSFQYKGGSKLDTPASNMLEGIFSHAYSPLEVLEGLNATNISTLPAFDGCEGNFATYYGLSEILEGIR